MPHISFTSALKRFFPGLKTLEIPGDTVADVIGHLERQFPGLADYICDDQGRLRQHVNIFIGEELIQDKETLQDSLAPSDEVFILQALSGG